MEHQDTALMPNTRHRRRTSILPGDHFRLIAEAGIMLGHLDREDADRTIFDMQTANLAAWFEDSREVRSIEALPRIQYEPVTPLCDNREETYELWVFALDWFHENSTVTWGGRDVDDDLDRWSWELYCAIDEALVSMGNPGHWPRPATSEARAVRVQPFRRVADDDEVAA